VLTFKPARGMKSTQRPSFDEKTYSIEIMQCSIYEGIILPQLKRPKILGYKDTLFRL